MYGDPPELPAPAPGWVVWVRDESAAVRRWREAGRAATEGEANALRAVKAEHLKIQHSAWCVLREGERP